VSRELALSVEPGGRAYIWAGRLSWCLGAVAALFLLALVPHWYFALPAALVGLRLTTSLCGALWYELRELVNCPDRLHRILAALTLTVATPVGLAGFCLIPNWSDFECNGHPSLVALVGSILLGMVSFATVSGVIVFVGLKCQRVALRLVGRSAHDRD
jgi:hypothetical protein